MQFANVTEYAHVTGWDPTAGATSTGTGIGIQASSGTSVPSAAGELVLGGAFVTRPTPFTVGGLVNPFSDLNVVSPYQGFGAYAIDAATGPLALVYDQTVGGTPTAGPWSAAVTAFTLTP